MTAPAIAAPPPADEPRWPATDGRRIVFLVDASSALERRVLERWIARARPDGVGAAACDVVAIPRGPERSTAAAALDHDVRLVLLWLPTLQTVRWLEASKRPDTRAMAVEWLKSQAPRGARVAVENSGPTYLDAAGFRVLPSELLFERPIDWYRPRTDYLVISSADLARYADYVNAGPVVFQAAPSPQRWGPPIMIVRIAR